VPVATVDAAQAQVGKLRWAEARQATAGIDTVVFDRAANRDTTAVFAGLADCGAAKPGSRF